MFVFEGYNRTVLRTFNVPGMYSSELEQDSSCRGLFTHSMLGYYIF